MAEGKGGSPDRLSRVQQQKTRVTVRGGDAFPTEVLSVICSLLAAMARPDLPAELLALLPKVPRLEDANRGDNARDQLRRRHIETGVQRATPRIRDTNPGARWQIADCSFQIHRCAFSAEDFVLVAFLDGNGVAGFEGPIDGGKRDGDVERNLVSPGEHGFGVGANLVGHLPGSSQHPIASHDDHVDLATLHQVAGGVVSDDPMINALLGQFPGGQTGSLASGPCLVAQHTKPSPLRLRGVHRGCGAAVIHKGKPSGVAVGQHRHFISDELRPVPTNRLAVRHIFVGEFFGRRHGQRLLFRHGFARLHFGPDTAHGVDGIDGCGSGVGQCLEDPVHVPTKSRPPLPVERAGTLSQAVGGGGADGAGASNDHVPNGRSGLDVVPGAHQRELMRQQALFDEFNLVGCDVEGNGAVMAGTAFDRDVHTCRRVGERCSAHIHLEAVDLLLDTTIAGVPAQSAEIRVAGDPAEITVTEADGPLQRRGGTSHLTVQGVAAGQVVMGMGIARFAANEPAINVQTVRVPAAIRITVAQQLQRLKIPRITSNKPFQEADLNIQLAAFLWRQVFPFYFVTRHTTEKKSFRNRDKSSVLALRPRLAQAVAMKCFVTGASGFIGANLVDVLNEHGHEVRALLRPGADTRGLEGATYEAVPGDLQDREALVRGLDGCDWCFHVAASYHLWLPDYAPMYAANVDGTRRVIETAQAAGCSRIVYTSTVGCIGLPQSVNGRVTPTDETTPVGEAQMSNHYKRSKWLAEVAARELASRGAPVVIVNPSAPIGPRDVKPTPTGKVIVDFLNRAMPAYLDTGLNWVHVRDVATGHVLAAEKGRIGERYILGNADGNWDMPRVLGVLSEITGLPAPSMRVPYGVALAAAYVNEAVAGLTRRPPKAPVAGVKMGRYKMWFNPAKAIRELGLPQTPPRQALEDAVEWFRANGYVKHKV